MTDEDRALEPITQASRMLAEAQTIPELKQVRDIATTAKAWAKSRHMGVDSENQASEYILRAERRIGQMLIDMAESGERATEAGNQRKIVGKIGKSMEVRPLDGFQPVLLSDLGVERHQSVDWQALARLPDDQFELLLAHAKAARERLAKVDFYRAAKKPTDSTPEVPIDKGFDMFRAGAYELVGWRIDNSGVGGPTRNGLLNLPDDELLQVAAIIKMLVTMYNEARQERA